jgi:predicted RNA binding protein YcfA (HicA-like mRNA interferase family)
MKFSELYRILISAGWYPVSQKGSHVKMRHPQKKGMIIFPNHGSREAGPGLVNRILKDAGIIHENQKDKESRQENQGDR